MTQLRFFLRNLSGADASLNISQIARRLRELAAIAILCGGAVACVQVRASEPAALADLSLPATVSGLLLRHPAGSIQSNDSAERALAESAAVRTAIETQYAHEQHDCHPKFFATTCLDDAKERRRAAVGRVRAVEIEAKRYKRRARVIERDRVLDQRQVDEVSAAPARMKMQSELEAKSAEKTATNALRQVKTIEVSVDRLPEGNVLVGPGVKRKNVRAESKVEADNRARNIAAYDKKVADATARQRVIAARKTEKESEKARKAAANKNGIATPEKGK